MIQRQLKITGALPHPLLGLDTDLQGLLLKKRLLTRAFLFVYSAVTSLAHQIRGDARIRDLQMLFAVLNYLDDF